jgi:hypothetical protein
MPGTRCLLFLLVLCLEVTWYMRYVYLDLYDYFYYYYHHRLCNHCKNFYVDV